MSLTKEEVEHIARLARLDLTDEQKARYRKQLEAILDHVARLQAVDTGDVLPTASVLAGLTPLRADEPQPGLDKEDLLGNAPQQDDDQFRIPPVFE
jgi:aspartyl-tRNA(Asn)/glutamyl-tRNA(Gln) amidotransferase subunit C